MARGGYRPNAGRPRSANRHQFVRGPDGTFATPLEYMLAVMNDPEADASRRDRMAIAAAAYMRPKTDVRSKKEVAAEAASSAGVGTDWGDDLTPSAKTN